MIDGVQVLLLEPHPNRAYIILISVKYWTDNVLAILLEVQYFKELGKLQN